MAHRPWTLSSLLTALTLAAACSSPPPPKPPEPEPKDKWDASSETKTAPKKCEALSEKCAAESDTKARIAKSGVTITPILGWTYAQGESATIAQDSDEGSAMAIASYEISGNAKQDGTARDGALDTAAKEIGVTLPKKKVNWKKADATKEVGSLKISLWETEGAARKDKKGILLIFASAAPLPENKAIVGLGFVPEDDKDAEQIGEALQKSIDSIALVEGPAAEPGK